ncbi:NAD(P)-dependent alcohol dehydrogenase [Streptomyces liangshanensis]|nr:NAD(P)-dependent alcohol dehydrogenase [Streptomyces liangshanensis]
MKAMVQDAYGPPDVLELRDIDRPEPRPDEVLVRVHAAAVDPGVWHLVAGLPYVVRLGGYGLRTPKARVRGMDVAGRVEAIGADVTRFRPGDEVFGTAEGSFAEYTRARQDRLAPKPANLTFEQAACVPLSAQTALQGLRDAGRIREGQRVLVIGAAGGVGAFAVQLAKVFGAHVTGVCGPDKGELVRSIGADEVVDYTREDITAGGRPYDLVLDTAGNRSLTRLRQVLTPRGTLVIVGGELGGRWLQGTDRQIRALLLSPWLRQNLRCLVGTQRAEDLEFLRGLVAAGTVVPVLDRTYPLGELPEAIRHVKRGHARGKVVMTV